MSQFKVLRPVPDELPSHYVEIHVAHCCNLTCESCSHYSNHGHRGIVGLEEADGWMKLWNRRLRPHTFGLVGGEPTMHPRLCEFVRLSRRNWPQAKMHLITNGLLLARHPDLPGVLRDTDTCLKLSIHHGSPQYRERIEPVLELVEAWVAQGNSAGVCPVAPELDATIPWLRLRDGTVRGPAAERSWETCPAKGCTQLFEGKLWKCAPLAYLRLQAEKYDLSEKWKPYLDYRPLHS